jgi:hypothetical protein
MKQTVPMSLIEAVTNVLVGFCIALLTQLGVFTLFGLQVTLVQHLRIGAIFTVVSLLRSFMLRRLFEGMRLRAEQSSAADR